MPVTIELNEKLASIAGGVESVEVQAATVQDAVIALAKLHRPVGARLFNCDGELRSVVKVEINGKLAPTNSPASLQLQDGDRVRLTFP